MQQAQLITLSKTQEFFNYKADRFTYTQNFDRNLAYGLSTERYMIQQAIGKGKPFSFELKSKQMDYVSKIYLEILLPQVRVPVETNPNLVNARFAWCPNIGNALIKDMSFKLGGVTVVQKMTGLAIQLQHEILYPYGKMKVYDRLVGNDKYLTAVSSPGKTSSSIGVLKESKTILVDLPFSFCMSREDALPILVFTNIQATIEVEFVDDLKTVTMFNDLMKEYVDNINFSNAAILLHGIAVVPKYRTLMTDKAKYPYLFKEIECKSQVSPGEEPTIKLNQASNNSVIESYMGVVKSGQFNTSKKYLVYKSGTDCDSWQMGLREAANRIATSMIRILPKPSSGTVDTNADLLLLPSEWRGNNNNNVNNIYLLNENLGYVVRPQTLIDGLAKKYLRIKVPPQILANYSIYVNLVTLIPKNNLSNSGFCLNNKIDEILVDGFLTGDPLPQDVTVHATQHWLNMRDISLSVNDCVDYRSRDDKVADLNVNNPFHTGSIIDGTGHLITSLKYNINGWNHEEPNHETHGAAQFMSVLAEKAPTRSSFFIIPFSGKIENRVWPDSSADLSRLESTELILKIDDPTIDYYQNSPYTLFSSDFRNRGAEVTTYCTYVKFPIDIVKGVTEYISADNIRKTVDDMIRLRSKFRVELPTPAHVA